MYRLGPEVQVVGFAFGTIEGPTQTVPRAELAAVLYLAQKTAGTV